MRSGRYDGRNALWRVCPTRWSSKVYGFKSGVGNSASRVETKSMAFAHELYDDVAGVWKGIIMHGNKLL